MRSPASSAKVKGDWQGQVVDGGRKKILSFPQKCPEGGIAQVGAVTHSRGQPESAKGVRYVVCHSSPGEEDGSSPVPASLQSRRSLSRQPDKARAAYPVG